MISNRVREMINLEIDGLLPPEDHAALRRLMEIDPEVSAAYEEHRRLNQMLASKSQLESPDSLKAKIIAEIQHHRVTSAQTTTPTTSFLDSVRTFFNWRSTYAFVGGAVTGIALFIVFSVLRHGDSILDNNRARGTMFLSGGLPEGRTIQQTNPNLNGARLEIKTREFEGDIYLDLIVKDEIPAELQVRFNGNDLTLLGIYTDYALDSRVNTDPGYLALHLKGLEHATLAYRKVNPDSQPIEIRIRTNGQEIVESLGTL